MKTEVIQITPIMAKDILNNSNYENRRLRTKHVDFLAKEMKDNWIFDGQPIRFSKEGRLLDGQHRLNALIKANKTIEFLIIKGISNDAFTVMDTGMNRSTSDVFNIQGVENASLVSASIKSIMRVKNGLAFHNGGVGGSKKVSNTDSVLFYENNPELKKFATMGMTFYHRFNKILSPTTIVTCLFLMSEKNSNDAINFWSELCGGNLRESSPLRILTNKLITDRLSRRSMSINEKMAIIFKTWNGYRSGKDIKLLSFNKNEKFPNLI